MGMETATRSTDPRVATAIAHWAPRFVSNGVLLADFEEVTAGIERWEDWCRAWCARGEVHEALGREALAQGHKLTAGEHLVRAAMYYHFAKFVFVHDQKQMRDAHLRSVECYQAALPLMRPAGERVAIPFEGKTLYGVLRRPAVASGRATGRSPILIMAPGLDSTKESCTPTRSRFLARGIAILAIDGPGQGEAEYEIPICGDYERAARAVCDWIEKRADLGRGQDRHVGREPRRLLRAARDGLRESESKPASHSPGRSNGRKSGARCRCSRARPSACAAIARPRPTR